MKKRNISKIKDKIRAFLVKSRLRLDEPMSRHTSLKVGGTADLFIQAEDRDELGKVLRFASRNKIPVSVIGSGTNLLVGDGGVRGIVVTLGKAFDYVGFNCGRLVAGASTPTGKLLAEAAERRLSGLEFMAGIPGTTGGAVIGNAGFPDDAIGAFVHSVKLMDYTGRISNLGRDRICFSYRNSSLKGKKAVVLEVTLDGLRKTELNFIEKRKKLFLKRRKDTQPGSPFSAGCIFKNPPVAPAGLLIDLAGLKGKKAGAAAISTKHANFIVNRGGARSRDIMNLIMKVRKKVDAVFDTKLELELERIGVFK